MSLAKISTVAVLTVLMGAAAFCASSSKIINSYSPWIDATGGPDAYEYTWIDSDEPGGPVFQWIDITTIGTEIENMGDDDYKGPFNLGFEFTYYWYGVSQIYIGSNGFLKIPPGYNIAPTFPATIPLASMPNDFIAGYMMDLDPTAGGEIWYWSNNTDQFIVSFINTPCWSTGGFHPFQMILDGQTNNIIVNYSYNQGTTLNDDILIGIENVNGQVGLLHSIDTYIPHDYYTILYDWPETSTYEVHDVAVQDVLTEGSKAIFTLEGEAFTPSVFVKNVGNQLETNVRVRAAIKNASGTHLWNEEYFTGNILPGEVIEVPFTTAWTTQNLGQYSVEADVTLLGDMNPNNDTKVAELDIVEIPGELMYDDGTAESNGAWQGDDGGYGVYFDSPEAPCEITLLRYWLDNVTPPAVFIARIYDDDGIENTPGTILFEESVNAIEVGWYNVVVPSVIVEDGKFYVAWMQTASASIYLGIDETTPISRNTWEYTGGWAPYRDLETDDVMIHALIGGALPPLPIIETSVDTLEFGLVVVGDTAWLDLTISNIGSAGDLILELVIFNGVPMNLIYTIEGFTPGMGIEPGDNAIISVRFHPVVAMLFQSDMEILSNAANGTAHVFCIGTGVLTMPVEVVLEPVGLPIQIPANGGTFEFNIGVANNGATQITADIWSMATLPNGSQYGPIIFFPDLTMNAGWSGDRDRDQNVPASAPAGAYTYDAYIGEYPNTVYDEDHFDFTKFTNFDGSATYNDWLNWGEEFADISESSDISIPETFTTLSAYPNPFNPSTNITYNLPETGNVRIAVFDISGRLVDVLFEGIETAGMHNLSFDAQNLSSGIYICRMSAGNELKSIKILLMK